MIVVKMFSIIKEEVDMVTSPVNISFIISVVRVSQEEGVEDRDSIFNSVKECRFFLEILQQCLWCEMWRRVTMINLK